MGWVALAITAGAALRLYLAAHVDSINSDGIQYIEAARHFSGGAWGQGLASFYPPGYPLAIAAVFPLFRNWEIAGTAVSLVTGMATFVPLVALLRLFRVDGLAFGGTVLGLALCPYPARYASIVRSEALYGLLLMLAVWAVGSYLVKERRRFLMIAGVAAGLAFNVRPEGIGLAVACGVGIALAFRDGGRGLRAALAPAAAVAVTAGALAVPYVTYLKTDTGVWMLSRKTSHVVSLGIKDATGEGAVVTQRESDRQGVAGVVAERWRLFGKKLLVDSVRTFIVFSECLHYAYVPFLLIGIAAARRRFPQLNWLLHAVVWLYVMFFAIVMVNRRFYTAVVPLALIWCGVGFARAWDWLIERQKMRAAVVLAAVVLAAILGKALRTPGTDQYARPFGQAIARRAVNRPVVVARVPQVAFYAGARRRTARFPIDQAQVVQWLQGPEIWLVAVDGDLTADAEALLGASPAVRLIGSITEKKGKQVKLYFFGRKPSTLDSQLSTQ